MELQYSELDNGIRLIKLYGVLDLLGVGLVERKLAEHSAGAQPWIILDLSGVTFIASIGIRLIVITAKSVSGHGGKLVLLNPIPGVKDILELTGITQEIPVYMNPDEAKSALKT